MNILERINQKLYETLHALIDTSYNSSEHTPLHNHQWEGGTSMTSIAAGHSHYVNVKDGNFYISNSGGKMQDMNDPVATHVSDHTHMSYITNQQLGY